MGFDYGQRHRVELDCRATFLRELRARFPHWSARLGEDHLLDLALLGQVSDTALTADKAIEFEKNGLPNTFVPGRNLIFFTFAAAIAYRRSLPVLVGGMCETDYSGYPDCRDDTLKALQVALSLGMDERLVIETPLMWLDKAHTWSLARDLGGEGGGLADHAGGQHHVEARPALGRARFVGHRPDEIVGAPGQFVRRLGEALEPRRGFEGGQRRGGGDLPAHGSEFQKCTDLCKQSVCAKRGAFLSMVSL